MSLINISISSETLIDGIMIKNKESILLAFDIYAGNENLKISGIKVNILSPYDRFYINNLYFKIDDKESEKKKIKNNKIVTLNIDNFEIRKGERKTIYIIGEINETYNGLALLGVKTNKGFVENFIIGNHFKSYNKIKLNLIKIYFKLLKVLNSKVFKKIKGNFKGIYFSLLNIYIYTFILSFLFLSFFYNKTKFINTINFFSKNELFVLFSIIILILMFIKNINNIIRYFSKYIFKLEILILIFLLSFLLEYTNNYFLLYFGFKKNYYYLFIFILIGIILKYLFLNERKDYRKGYIFNKYYKIYQSLENKNLETFLTKIYYFNLKPNFIEPIPDEPIGLGNNILGNEDFVKNLYDLINGINFKKFKKSYSIGIVGEWGGGKSSIINLLDEQFLDGNPNFKVLRFNPWDYKKENLIKSFFNELGKILEVKNLSNLFKNYLKLLGNIDSSVKIGTDFLSGFIGEKSLSEIREEINSKLKEFDRKIVVVVDDFDRCEPDEVLVMLNLVKNLGDFNNIIYLVSYDKEHIIKVLDEKGFDKDYIEKIINIERFIPVSGKEELKEYFKKQFDEILKSLKKDDNELFDKGKRQEIIDFLVLEFNEFFEKENLRFIKKLLNQLNVILQLNLEKEKLSKDIEIGEINNEDDLHSMFKIKDLSLDYFSYVLLINYVKLKDYNIFISLLNIFNIVKKNNYFSTKNKLNDNILNIEKNNYFSKFYYDILELSKYEYHEKQDIYIIRKNNQKSKNLEYIYYLIKKYS